MDPDWQWTTSGQIIATSHDLTPNGGLVREIPLFQGNLGWWNIIIWPDHLADFGAVFGRDVFFCYTGYPLINWHGKYISNNRKYIFKGSMFFIAMLVCRSVYNFEGIIWWNQFHWKWCIFQDLTGNHFVKLGGEKLSMTCTQWGGGDVRCVAATRWSKKPNAPTERQVTNCKWLNQLKMAENIWITGVISPYKWWHD